MGLYDDVKCLYRLPWPEAQGGWFQSYDTDAQYCERYELRENGELWHRKVKREMEMNEKAPLGYYMVEVSAEWVREMITGEIELHAFRSFEGINYSYSVQFWFRDGVVKDVVFDRHQSSNQATDAEPWGAIEDERQNDMKGS